MLAFLPGCVPREDDKVRLRASFWSPPGLQEQVVARFEAENPGVDVELLITGGRYAEKVQSMIVAGNEPDVLMVHDTFAHDWVARNVFTDVTELVRSIHARDPFLPMPLKVFEADGRFAVVPYSTTAMLTYGNLDHLRAAGVPFPWSRFTWAQIEELGPKFSRYGGNPDSPTEYLCALPQEWFFLVAYGARCFDDPHRPTKVVVEEPITIDAFNFWRRMHQRGWAVPRSTVLDRGESEMFRDGHLALLFENRMSARIMGDNRALRWDIAPLPAGPRGVPTVPHMSAALGISRRSKHPELARKFIEFYISDPAAKILVDGGRTVPVRRRQAYSDLLLAVKPPDSTLRWVEPLEEGGITALAYTPGRIEIDNIVRKRFEQALAEPNVPTEAIVAGLASDLRAWLVKMQEKGLL